MKKYKILLSQLLIGLIPIGYSASIWPNLPNIVPVHYNMHFIADKFGPKSQIIVIQIAMLVFSVIMSLLLINLHKLDPKRRYSKTNTAVVKISWIIIVFTTLTSLYIVYKTANYINISPINYSDKYLMALLFLMLAFLGNFINNIKQNYFVGIRTPWNLRDEDNWRKTHHLGSKIWFFGGLLMCMLTLILPQLASPYIAIAGLILLGIIPVGYSYHLYKSKKNT